MYGCEESIGIAPDGVLDDNFVISSVDTFYISSYTHLADSIITSTPSYLIAGASTFNYSGNVESKAYLNIRPGGDLNIDETTDNYDSIYLLLYFNDLLTTTDEAREYTVHLLDPVGSEDLEGTYYNFDKLSYSESPIGSFVYSSSLNVGDSIAIKIESGLGEELFSWAKDGIITSSNSEFISRFTGFVIKASDDNVDQIIRLSNNQSTASQMNKLRLYYHEQGDFIESKYFDFFDTQYTATFNSINASLEGSWLEKLASEDQVHSSETGNMSFLQSGIGIYSRFTFPYLYRLNELDENYIINSAELIIEPLTASYSSSKPLPDSLAIYFTTNLDESLQFNYNSSVVQEYLQYAKLNYDYEQGGKARYSFNVTDLIYMQLEDNGYREYSVLLTPTFLSALTCFDQVQIPDRDHSSPGVRLKIYITKILNLND